MNATFIESAHVIMWKLLANYQLTGNIMRYDTWVAQYYDKTFWNSLNSVYELA